MNLRQLCFPPLLVLLLAMPMAGLIADTAVPPRDITWDDLIPAGWVPPAVEIDHFFDAAPAPAAALADTPIVADMNEQRVRLPAYLVPLDVDGESLRSFLLVPYFGACIHVPPPPPNQVVYVEMPEAISLEDPYGAHWVTGVLSTQSSSTSMAEAGYSMRGEKVEPFDWDSYYEQARQQREQGSQP